MTNKKRKIRFLDLNPFWVIALEIKENKYVLMPFDF